MICDFSDYEMNEKHEVKKQDIKHAYKTIKFQYEKYKSFCQNEESLMVHLGKNQSENIEFGFCDTIFKT